MNIIAIVGGIIAALLVALKIKNSQNNKLKGELMTKEAQSKSDIIDTKREVIKDDLNDLEKSRKTNNEEALKESPSDYWKKKL